MNLPNELGGDSTHGWGHLSFGLRSFGQKLIAPLQFEVLAKMGKIQPENPKFFVYEPNWFKFLEYISNKILTAFE